MPSLEAWAQSQVTSSLPPSGEKKKVHCWNCGALALEYFSYLATYTCKICWCSGSGSVKEGREEFTNPGAQAKFRGVTGTFYDPYIDFGDTEGPWHSSSPA